MASAIGAGLISTILKPMADLAIDSIKDKGRAIRKCTADKAVDKARDWVVDKVDGIVNIERDISNLQNTLLMIQSIVQVAEEKQIDNVFIQNWLRDLVDVGYEARDVLEDFIAYSSCIRVESSSRLVIFISSQISFLLSYFGGLSSDASVLPLTVLNQLAKDIRSVRERFDEKKKEAEEFKTLRSVVVVGGSESVRVNSRSEVGPYLNQQGDNLFLGREEVKEGIMEKILQPEYDRVDVVVIWGMGGIGKTTLAQSIYNDESVKKVPRRWLCVGESKFCAEKVIREIVNDKKSIGIENLQEKLVEKFRGNRFLIVLDDVWDVDGSEWDKLFNPLTNVKKGLKGGMIIITTRKREVCTATNTQTTYDLKPLSEEDSWSIFESCAYVKGISDSAPELKSIGEEIVKKLNGHPLALKVVGRSLLNKDYSTWTNFLESNDWMLIDDDNDKDKNIMSVLRWSYNHLPRHLKTCFTCCALFPKDHVFDNEKVLVQMWMAHDLIQKEERKRPEDVGAQYFEELVNASLLQRVDEKYVMHDLIHDLALLVSNGEFASANSSLTNDQIKRVRHITTTNDDYSEIPRLCKIEKLLTLYTICSDGEDLERFHDHGEEDTNCCHDYVLDNAFKQLKSIRVLVLSHPYIREIPDWISELRHLRYLDVSETGVESLPDSLCRLYNLQMLAAPFEAKLPRDIVNMVNLRYLRARLSTCKGVGKLTSLQELDSIHICEGDNIRELGDMQRLRGELRIEGFGNVTSSEDAAGALLKNQTLMDELAYWHSDEKVLDALGCPPNLKCLSIFCYAGVKSPSWMVDGKHEFGKLHRLELSYCSNWESLPPLGELPSLKNLFLADVGGKRLGDEFYGKITDGKVFFPSLEYLSFSSMYKWEEWDDIIIENSSVSFFPRLTTLAINNCPKLVSVLRVVKNAANFMTSLSRLEISECPQLKMNCCPLLYERCRDWPKFDKLQTLRLSNCSNWESLPPLGELTFLKDLYLANVGGKRLGDEFYGKITDDKVFFPSLESVSFSYMKEWEEWDEIIIENSSVSFFPLLTTLEIRSCEKLVSVLPVVKNAANFMTSLSSLSIINCPQLHSLPADGFPPSIRRLSIIKCPLLYERCKDESGPHWHKIKDIPYKDIRQQYSLDDEINLIESITR